MRYEKTRQADEDLLDIYLYGYLNFGQSQAEKYLSDLESTFELLAETPFACRERTEFIPPVRIHHHGRQLIIYIVETDHILSVRVLDDNMGVEQHI